MSKSTEHCTGCRNNFYNGNNPMGVKVCWYLEGAKVVKRWRIGTWTVPHSVECFQHVTTYDCHQGDGWHDFAELPEHLRADQKGATFGATG
jgi:hypothetical protein